MFARMVSISRPHDPPALASQSAKITEVSHRAWPGLLNRKDCNRVTRAFYVVDIREMVVFRKISLAGGKEKQEEGGDMLGGGFSDFFETESRSVAQAGVQSQLTVTFTSQVQVILLLQPPE